MNGIQSYNQPIQGAMASLLNLRYDELNKYERELFHELADEGMPSDEFEDFFNAIQADRKAYFDELMTGFSPKIQDKHNVNSYLPKVLKKLGKPAIALGIAGLVLTAGCIVGDNVKDDASTTTTLAKLSDDTLCNTSEQCLSGCCSTPYNDTVSRCLPRPACEPIHGTYCFPLFF